jgi:hypothetical protein
MEYQDMGEDSGIDEEDVINDAKIRKWCKIVAIGLIGALVVFIVWLFMSGSIYTMRLV